MNTFTGSSDCHVLVFGVQVCVVVFLFFFWGGGGSGFHPNQPINSIFKKLFKKLSENFLTSHTTTCRMHLGEKVINSGCPVLLFFLFFPSFLFIPIF